MAEMDVLVHIWVQNAYICISIFITHTYIYIYINTCIYSLYMHMLVNMLEKYKSNYYQSIWVPAVG